MIYAVAFIALLYLIGCRHVIGNVILEEKNDVVHLRPKQFTEPYVKVDSIDQGCIGYSKKHGIVVSKPTLNGDRIIGFIYSIALPDLLVDDYEIN